MRDIHSHDREPSLNLQAMQRPVPRSAVLGMEDWYVWGASMVRTGDGVCHLLFSRWPRELGHQAWVTHSGVGYATADGPLGPYTFRHVALAGSGGEAFDRDVTHNPTVLRAGDRFYLCYTGNRGNGEMPFGGKVVHGVAFADNPLGPFERHPEPVLSHPTERFPLEDPTSGTAPIATTRCPRTSRASSPTPARR